ncbi:glycosyltransferase [Arthrobacter mobilis]|uniref:Glycosyltransferase family 4 protein n=1 Tax=Arthrobacter mobilis TaxID=2724944 RepID=A0A7X6HEE1_9MICC|nr:glycosyltransferase [Arthrobacter mobilis]NKX54137.1 glycosyltransferase family 4 protein [Arthrobacter mobilis]
MRILLWHVHGGWTDAFVRGRHEYLLPATPDGGPWGLGRGGRDWPAAAREVDPGRLREEDIDVVLLQRPEELDACERLLGRRPGRDLPAVYLEHNTPKGSVPDTRHPLADQQDIPIVHVTHFNNLFWDCGSARTTVVEHGIADPGYRYTGAREHLGVVVNEPVRRWRVTGTDLLPGFAAAGPLEVFGMGGGQLGEATGLGPDRLQVRGDLPTAQLHHELAGCRVYLHLLRWTSLGLSLLEAMHLGMPVVVLDATEASRAVPPEAGAISTDVGRLQREAARLLADPDEARARGRAAREAALQRYSLAAFLDAWDNVLADTPQRARRLYAAAERRAQ